MQSKLINLITARLNQARDDLKEQFNRKHSIKVARHFVLDNLLPMEIAENIYSQFPKKNQMRLINSRGELKLKFSMIKNTSQLLQDINYAIQNTQVVAMIEEITEIKNQIPDPSFRDGGVSALFKGYYINPHLDNSHDVTRNFYRAVNVLYYVSPNWKIENGGNYELWDEAVRNCIVIPSLFNRLVVMETNTTSWHAVSPVLCRAPRCCVFNYFFSPESPESREYSHGQASTFLNPVFKPRPEHIIRRALYEAKNKIVRKLLSSTSKI